MPVEDYPTLPEMPAATGTVQSDEFAHAVAQAVTAAGRDDMLPVLTGVRIEIDGSTISLLATDRFRLSPPRARLEPAHPRRVDRRAGPGQGARRHRQVADLRQRGHHRAGRQRLRRGHHRLRGRGAPAAYAVRPPGCSTASSPRSAACSRNEHQTTALVDKAALIESVKRVALVAERNTAVQLAFSDGVLTLDAGSGDEAQASESIEATIDGEDITTGFNPQFLLDGLTAIDEPVVELAFTQASKPVVISGSVGDGAARTRGFRYLLMPRRLLS